VWTAVLVGPPMGARETLRVLAPGKERIGGGRETKRVAGVSGTRTLLTLRHDDGGC